jgi:protein phosphatase 1L
MKLFKTIFFIVMLFFMEPLSAKVIQQKIVVPTTPINQTITTKEESLQPALTTAINKEKSKFNYGLAIDKNKREYQEDRFTYAVITVMDDKNTGNFFAIYDGHNGDKASSYLQENLHKYFIGCLANKKTIQEAFACAFLKTEDYCLQHFNDGSTVIAAYIDTKNILHFGWVGDSRAVLEKNGAVNFATQDHKPNRKDELNRIGLAGGKIHKEGVWRINGLAISRSIGDKSLKEGKQKGQIIAVPEYSQVQLDSDNHFLIIASDGLWDVMKNTEAVTLVKEKLKNTTNIDTIAHDLKNEAIKRGSQDNITVCIVTFDGLKKPATLSRFTRLWNWLRGK